MRFLILISLLALVAVVAAERHGELKPKALTGAAQAVPVNGTLPTSNSTTTKNDADGTSVANTTEASGTEANSTGDSTTEASTTVLVKA